MGSAWTRKVFCFFSSEKKNPFLLRGATGLPHQSGETCAREYCKCDDFHGFPQASY
jgi:hypothetical protein